MSVLQGCPSYRESNEGSKGRQGPTLGVRFTEVAVSYRCLSYRESYKGSKERQGRALGVRFIEVSFLYWRCALREIRVYIDNRHSGFYLGYIVWGRLVPRSRRPRVS